jgi:hypothetical protein
VITKMRTRIVLAALLLACLACAHSPQGRSSVIEFSSAEDHFYMLEALTAQEYLHLSKSGHYEMVAVEHMGVIPADSGHWEIQEGILLLHSEDPAPSQKPSVRSYRPIAYKGIRILSCVSPGVDGEVDTPESIKAQIDKGNGKLPVYRFVEISKDTFEKGSTTAYPFKFYPEMNKRKQ